MKASSSAIKKRRQAEQAAALLSAIVDSSDDAIVSKDLSGVITSWNKGAELLFGYTAEEIIGRPVTVLIPTDRLDEETKILEQIKRGERVDHFETIRVRKDGSPLNISLTISPVKDADGRIVGASKIARDITERRQAEQAFALLSAIVDSSDDAIISKDLNGVITSWNKSAELLFGYTAEEIIGQAVTVLIPPDRLNEEPIILDRLRRGERVDHFETIRVRKDGSRLNISLTISPVKDAHGRIVGASKVARNITGRKQTEIALSRRHAQFETLFNQAPLGVYLVDADLRITEVNPTAWLVFGDIPGLIGRAFDEVIHILWEKRYADEIVAIFRHTLETGDPYVSAEQGGLRLDRGTIEYYEWRLDCIPLADGRYGLVCYFRDISAQVQARNALSDYAEQLKQADQRKDEFLATLAHELRNPLAPISNAVELMKRPNLTVENFELARKIAESQLKQMVRLVDDLLDISRISQGKIELKKERVTLKSIIDQALETSQPHVETAGHKLAVSLPPRSVYLDGDPVRLAQVVSNLINNACKYSANNGSIEVKAEVKTKLENRGSQRNAEDGNGAAVAQFPVIPSMSEIEMVSESKSENPKITMELVLSVKDTGIGIAPEHLPRIFTLFSQVGAALDRSQGGLGIGLSLVRGLVELHGGSVEARSEGLGKGSEFIVRLPTAHAIAEESGLRSGDETLRSILPGRKRILVVDDNKPNAQSLALLLDALGYDARPVYDAKSALEILDEFTPQVALIDIGLPDTNGYELARRLRGLPQLKGITLIAQTGWGRDEDREEAKQAGFDHHLTKPIDHQVLQNLLRSESH